MSNISVDIIPNVTERRRSFTLKKILNSVTNISRINIEDENKGGRPPIIPSTIKVCTDEILKRIKSHQLKALPDPFLTLFSNADELKCDKNKALSIEALIHNLRIEKQLSTLTDINQHRNNQSDLSTATIVCTLFRYFEFIEDGLTLKLEYPVSGFIILGPPLTQTRDKIDISRYIRELESFLSDTCEIEPIRRDIFCHIMDFLATIYEITSDSYRNEPSVCSLMRFILASRFAPVLLVLHCTICNEEITDHSFGCDTCSEVIRLLKPPYTVDVIDNLLNYVPSTFWKGTLSSPRTVVLLKRDPTTVLAQLVRSILSFSGIEAPTSYGHTETYTASASKSDEGITDDKVKYNKNITDSDNIDKNINIPSYTSLSQLPNDTVKYKKKSLKIISKKIRGLRHSKKKFILKNKPKNKYLNKKKYKKKSIRRSTK